MAPNKSMTSDNGGTFSKFGSRPPDIIPVTFMKDNAFLHHEVLREEEILPLNSSTLTRNKSNSVNLLDNDETYETSDAKKTDSNVSNNDTYNESDTCESYPNSVESCKSTKKLAEITVAVDLHSSCRGSTSNLDSCKKPQNTLANEKSDSQQSSRRLSESDNESIFELDRRKDLSNHSTKRQQSIKKFEQNNFNDKLMGKGEGEINTENSEKPTRKLPTIPSQGNAADRRKQFRNHSKASNSLASSLFSSFRKTASRLTRSESTPTISRNQKSFKDRFRQSTRRHHTVDTYPEDINSLCIDRLFPIPRERECYEYAKRRGRRGAVISLEFNQSVSLVTSASGHDRYQEFQFVPKTP